MAGGTCCARSMWQKICCPRCISKSLHQLGSHLAWLWQSCWPQRSPLWWVLQLRWGDLLTCFTEGTECCGLELPAPVSPLQPLLSARC